MTVAYSIFGATLLIALLLGVWAVEAEMDQAGGGAGQVWLALSWGGYALIGLAGTAVTHLVTVVL